MYSCRLKTQGIKYSWRFDGVLIIDSGNSIELLKKFLKEKILINEGYVDLRDYRMGFLDFTIYYPTFDKIILRDKSLDYKNIIDRELFEKFDIDSYFTGNILEDGTIREISNELKKRDQKLNERFQKRLRQQKEYMKKFDILDIY